MERIKALMYGVGAMAQTYMVKFMVENYDLPYNKAARVVTSEDKRRMSLYRKIGKSDYDKSELYHLVLNMNRMDIDKALELVCTLVGK